MQRTTILILLVLSLMLTGCDQYEKVFKKSTAQNVTQQKELNFTVINATINETNSTNVTEIVQPDNTNFAMYIKDNAIIIKQNDKAMMIDTGSESKVSELLQFLRNREITKLEMLILTNTNEKRIGGVPYIISKTNPTLVYDTGVRNVNTQVYQQIYNLSIPVAFDTTTFFQDTIIQMIVPYDDGKGLSDNEDTNSIVVKVKYGSLSVLYMSDCDTSCELRLGDIDLKAKILVVSGSCSSTSLLFLTKIMPENVIMLTECDDIKQRITNMDIPIKGQSTIFSDGVEYQVTG